MSCNNSVTTFQRRQMDRIRCRQGMGRFRNKVSIAGPVESGNRPRLSVATDLLADEGLKEGIELLRILGDFERRPATFFQPAMVVAAVLPATWEPACLEFIPCAR